MKTAKELINIICPDHSRTSCSDENIDNGFYTHDETGHPRCRRCALIELAYGEPLPDPLKTIEWL